MQMDVKKQLMSIFNQHRSELGVYPAKQEAKKQVLDNLYNEAESTINPWKRCNILLEIIKLTNGRYGF